MDAFTLTCRTRLAVLADCEKIDTQLRLPRCTVDLDFIEFWLLLPDVPAQVLELERIHFRVVGGLACGRSWGYAHFSPLLFDQDQSGFTTQFFSLTMRRRRARFEAPSSWFLLLTVPTART